MLLPMARTMCLGTYLSCCFDLILVCVYRASHELREDMIRNACIPAVLHKVVYSDNISAE